jgi:hypothetical protein
MIKGMKVVKLHHRLEMNPELMEDENEPGPSGRIPTTWGTKRSKLSLLKFTGNRRGVRREETPSINKDSTLSVFLLAIWWKKGVKTKGPTP